MDEHPNVTLMRKLGDAMDAGDMETGFAALADDIEWHQIGAEPIIGKQALIEYFQGSGWEITSKQHDIVGNGEHVVQLLDNTVQKGDETFHYRTAEIFHVQDGKVTARWTFSDDTQAIIDFFS